MVLQVPLAGESVTRNAALAAFVVAKERLITMAVESVGLALMAQEAGRRGETGALTGVILAAVRLQMGVDKLADRG